MSESRQLRTILFADIAGYTALMQKDEPNALGMLGRFKTILEETVPTHQGEIIQYFGDGCLLAFDSATHAVTCALSLQQDFIQADVPIRIGMHLGDVILRNENLFGDGVNIASRVESISIPGAILLSKPVRDQIKNRPEFGLLSLGHFNFKNVSEPTEVYALTNEGLQVPDRKKLTGKIVAKKDSLNTWLIGLGILAILCLAVGAMWYLKKDASSSSLTTTGLLQEQIRKKRVAVMVFDNETNEPQYDAFGKMISDWVTTGLMELGTANVINAANIEKKIEQFGEGPSPEFASATGVDLMLKGRYYIFEGQLIIRSDLINANTGSVIHALQKIEGRKEDLTAMLHEFTQEVLGYWAVKDLLRFSDDPPSYEAYQQWLKAGQLQISQPQKAIEYIKEAYRLDSTFVEPLISLFGIYSKEGMHAERDSIFELLLQKTDQLSKWERLRFEELKAIRNKDWLKVAELAENRYRMDSSEQQALITAINAYNYSNYPSKALELINSFDTIYLSQDLRELSWRETDQVFPNFLLRNYQTVDRIATSYDRAKIPDALAIMHLQALIQWDSLDRLDKFYEKYKEQGLYNNSGKPTPLYISTIMVCDMLYITEKREVLGQYLTELSNILSENPNHPQKHNIEGYIHFYSEDLRAAARSWEKEKLNKADWPGWLWINLQYDRLSRIAYCYAILEDQANLNRSLQLIEQLQDPASSGSEIHDYYQSRIFAAKGQAEKAISSLQQAVDKGFSFYGPNRFRNDPFLKPLSGHPDFVELVRPKE